MKFSEALRDVTRLFLDTAPVIYFVEKHPTYLDLVAPIFHRIDADSLVAVTSPVTLAECLVMPYRLGLTKLQQDFTDLIVYGQSTVFAPIDDEVVTSGRRVASKLQRHVGGCAANRYRSAYGLRGFSD